MKLSSKASVMTVMGIAVMSFSTLSAAQGVTGAGASFPAPLYFKWAADYNKATGVKINYQSVGSGAGIKQIDAKTVERCPHHRLAHTGSLSDIICHRRWNHKSQMQ